MAEEFMTQRKGPIHGWHPDKKNAALSDLCDQTFQKIQVRAAVLFGSCATGKK
jgi:hypothetical protein